MRLKLKPKYALIIAITVAIPVALLVINTADSDSAGTSPVVMPQSGTANEQVELRDQPAETTARLRATPEAAETVVGPEPDGAALLQIYCAQCHSVKLLEKTRMSRADWEKTLSRMERYSELSSDTEKLLVLEHLVAPDKP